MSADDQHDLTGIFCHEPSLTPDIGLSTPSQTLIQKGAEPNSQQAAEIRHELTEVLLLQEKVDMVMHLNQHINY